MRMRLLLTAGLAVLVSSPGAAGALAPLRLREQPRPQSTFVAPPRPLPHFRMRWAHGQRLRKLAAATAHFAGGRAVVGLADPVDAAAVARAFQVSPVYVNPGLRALEVVGDQASLQALAAAVGADARIRYVEPLRRREIFHKRNDPLTTTIDGLPRSTLSALSRPTCENCHSNGRCVVGSTVVVSGSLRLWKVSRRRRGST